VSDQFFLTNLELRESDETGEMASGLSHSSMKGMLLFEVLELAAIGEPRGTVTVVHDAGEHGGRYKEFAKVLAASGWAVALPSMRGHGGTEGERGHSAGSREVVRDLTEVQNHLAYRLPDSPKVLIGQGLGAIHCVTYAVEQPGMARAIVLLAPLFEPSFEAPLAPKGLKKFFNKIGPTSPGRVAYAVDALTADEAVASDYAADPRVHDVITQRAIEEASDAARQYLPKLSELGIPILILHGSDDSISAVSKSQAVACAGIEVQVIEGGRHHLLQDRERDACAQTIASWLDSALPRE
jgi:acylglycerol lipase